MFGLIPLPPSWPVYVSLAEASAFARWRGARLPTEAEFQRAAYGSPAGERQHPWGDEAPAPRHGVFDFASWDPEPAGSHPDGASAWGVEDLVGNGWEWTSTPFAPFPGFRAMASYPEYSADFFDGAALRHEGRVAGHGARIAAADVPQLVPSALSVCLCHVPLRQVRLTPSRRAFAEDVAYYLAQTPRQLPSRYLYDELGSSLFEAICRLPWYRITRTEQQPAEDARGRHLRPAAPISTVVELGPGSGEKLVTLMARLAERAM